MDKQIIFNVLIAAYGVALEEEHGGSEPLTSHITSEEIEKAIEELGVKWQGMRKV